MRPRGSARRVAGALSAGLLATALLAGCGGAGSGKTKLTIGLFGDFGYADLFTEYEQSHPDIDIVDSVAKYDDHHTSLATHLATNSGAADIEAVDTGYIAQFKQNPKAFVDLNTKGGADLKNRWLSWKWESSLGKGGEQIGYGTDVGGLAICYRKDLFAEAGLPTERDQVGAAWPTWQAFLDLGRQFQARAPQGTKWFDGGPTLFNSIVGQAGVGYYDKSDQVVLKDNAEIKQAWDLVTGGVTAGLSAGLKYSTPEWNTGFKQNQFATVACPAWQMAKIQQQAPDTAGKWDVAPVPGGGGNWGGSYLTVPSQGDHIDQAVELVTWLTAPEQQAKVFTKKGLLPSTPELYDRPEITSYTNPFFSDAPVGKLFTDAARKLEPQYQGPQAGAIQEEMANAMLRVEQGKQSPDESWNQAVGDVQRLIK
ncbi:ABC transporter substrate-binding protein [Goodfellowiella coeruleoviolacea]|uniref:Cellobiose-binding protein n=1 Tax=Goodfellowiella coeruleoviolacea TaxID=334858 RepID=A0AAE3G9K4_9PSEU|nr:extracellular solute-binding protein [Goodfellowiella coeruleoviolacea]MCP2164171.1 cellobiose-binding protein [Goodfellowiella coeruleoviolacea]